MFRNLFTGNQEDLRNVAKLKLLFNQKGSDNATSLPSPSSDSKPDKNQDNYFSGPPVYRSKADISKAMWLSQAGITPKQLEG